MLPPYLDPEVHKLDFATRAKIIYNYHIELNKLRYETQLKLEIYKKWSKPIQASNKFKGSLQKDVEKNALTLRRCERLANKYEHMKCSDADACPNDEDNDNEMDMLERDLATLTKKQILSPEKHQTIPKCKTPKSENEIVIKLSSETKPNDTETKCNDTETKPSKRLKYTNSEIIRKSKLFASPANKRTEGLLEQGLNENDNIEKKAVELMKFEATLKGISDDEKEESDNKSDDNPSPNEPKGITQRKRIPPPLHGKNKRVRSTSTRHAVSKKPKYHLHESASENFQSSSTLDLESLKDDSENVMCPLCSKPFAQNEIEMHASNCCLTQISETEQTEENQNMIKCEVCDNFFILDTDYEVHVKDCLRELRRRSKKL